MPRPKFEGILNMNCPGMSGRFAGWAGRLQGHGFYEVSVVPRNDTRTSAQNRYFHGVPCKYLAEYLRAQDASMSPFAALVIAKGTLKDQIIRTPTICKGTGELIGSYVPSTADLSVDAMSDLIERSRVW